MRRTYRSKKETGGGLDPRDMVLAMDEKSSIFDAFYIQNIKQTKRELSVAPSIYTASNKVRKRKYVKRLKEQELAHKKSTLKSGCLTPDKSIHVTKPLDPFDLLLSSSTTNEKCTESSNNKKPINVIINNKCTESSNNKKPIKGQRKRYQKKKLSKKMFNNFSSETTDSDKENCVSNSNQNLSDVLSHNLLIEKENNIYKKDIDESISTNLSLLKKLQDSSCLTPNLLPNIKDKSIRQSDQNSPLCSTPFLTKYRGKSIFKFSPIYFNVKEGYDNITAKKDENNIVINNSINIEESDFNTPKKVRNTSGMYKVSPMKQSYDFNKISSPILGRLISKNKDANNIESKQHNSLKCEQSSVFEISDEEPFLGFSACNITKIKNLETVNDKYKDINGCVFTRISPTKKISQTQTSSDLIIPQSDNVNSFGENSYCKNVSKDVDTINKYDESQSYLDFTELNKENAHHSLKNENSQYLGKGACSIINNVNNIEEIVDQNKSCIIESQPVLLSNSLEEANRLKVDYDIEISRIRDENVKQNSTNIVNEEKKELGDKSIDENEYQLGFYDENTFSKFVNNETLYESCNSDTFSMDDQDEQSCAKIEHLSDSAFQKSYPSLADTSLEGDETYKYSNEHSFNDDDDDDKENNTILERASSSYNDSYQDNVISMLCGEENTNDNDFEKTLPENSSICYVTKRRKKDVIKDSFIFLFDGSFCNTSSCDINKTVLNNTKYSIDTKENQAEIMTNNDTTLISDRKSVFQMENKRTSYNSTKLSLSPDLKGELSRKSVPCKPSLKTRKSSILSRKSVKRQSIKENSLQGNEKSTNTSQFQLEKPNKKSTFVPVENISLSKCEKNCISNANELPTLDVRYGIVLEPGKRWERSYSIYRRITTMNESFDSSILDEEPLNRKGRKYRQSVISTMEMQNSTVSLHNESLKSRKSTIFSKPSRSTIRIVRESNASRISLCSNASENLNEFLTEDCDDTVFELSKLSIIDSEHEVTVLDKFNDTSNRIITARDYILRRCNQTDVILFDECYPDTVLKNCRKIGEGVYGEVFLWRARDGRARVLKIVPIAGTVKVNGESQKDYHEVISEIVIAMELSALRAPIQEIEKHLDEGKGVETLDLHSVENATDVFNEVLAVRCVYGSYPSRLLDLWELYDECKGSDNDNPAVLPVDQQFMVLELANAGQDLESYQFNNAEQAFALFQQVAYGLAVAEEAFQFEHRDLHWGNVLISPTDQKYATFVLRGRPHRLARRGVAATIIDYSLSRLSLKLPADSAALYNDLAADEALFDAVGDYQFEVYRLMREKLGNDWKNFEPYTNILWLHYTVDKMITALRYTRTNTKIHKHYIARLKEIKNRILDYGSAVQYVLIDNEL